MARWYLKRGGRYYRYGRFRGWKSNRGYGSRKYYGGYSRKYVNASSRSSVRMKTAVNISYGPTAGYGDDGTGAQVYGYTPYLNSSASATASPLFRTYCALYEEVKCVGMKVQFAVTTPVGGSDVPSLQIYTAWDRRFGYGEVRPTTAEVKAASSSNVATCLNNNVAKFTRSCYASDLMEKAQWMDSTLEEVAATPGYYINSAWQAAGLNPNCFCPAFEFFLTCPTLGATKTINVSISIVYYFAFRNPRFGTSGADPNRMIDLGPRSVVPDASGDLDEDDPLVEAAKGPDDEEDDLIVHDETTRAPTTGERVREARRVRLAHRDPIIHK